ncbi:hypothetical protein IEQ34_008822 [Dendrobium chrysotoxum]|uniref:PPPDE domain-containing protein n=1 Tax=Dendrobium chrysotoxum TaxID=161865 RepID=A0AAV7GXN0_DENCH|nr:hypothetical protein IEQ34_008822 [Dendrobium chrysotoxum]
MFIRCPSVWKRKTGAVPVYLNVYDLTPINGYAYWFGLGVYHSGVQVHGVEYAYGAHDHPTTGIFDAEPRSCPGFAFRKSILIGRTDLGPEEVQDLMEELAESYTGNAYNLISKNCNHFCNDACIRLTGNAIPSWVNRLANLGTLSRLQSQNDTKPQLGFAFNFDFDFLSLLITNLEFFSDCVGFFCKCVLPVHVAAVRSRTEDANGGSGDGERRRLRSGSTRYGGHASDADKHTSVISGRRSGSRRKRLEPSATSAAAAVE